MTRSIGLMKPATCPSPPASPNDASAVVGSTSFYSLAIIISGAACLLTCSISFFLIMMHATHFSIPKEQRLIIRVIFCLPVFAFISLLNCWLTEASKYIEPWRNVYEAFALACFFLLMCNYISLNAAQRDDYFNGHELQNHRGEILRNGYFEGFKKCWIGVFQFPVVSVILAIVQDVTEASGTFCKGSRSFHFANAWVKLFTLISTGIAVFSVLRLYRATKPAINHHKPILKLIAFKLLVFLSFVQNAIFTYGLSAGSIHPTQKLTYNDLIIHLPNLLLAIETALIALLFPVAYPSKPYHQIQGAHYLSDASTTHAQALPEAYEGGPGGMRALAQALDIRDFLLCYTTGAPGRK